MRDLPPFQNNPVFSPCKQCKSDAVCKKKDKCLLKAGEEFSSKFKSILLDVTQELQEMRSPASNTEFSKLPNKVNKIMAQGTQGKNRKLKDDHSFKHTHGRIQPGAQRAAHDKTSSARLAAQGQSKQAQAISKTRTQRKPKTPLDSSTEKRRQETTAQEQKDLSSSKMRRALTADPQRSKHSQEQLVKQIMRRRGVDYKRAVSIARTLNNYEILQLFS